ncbi:MAG: hypothetical protein ACRYFK_04485 [Janthinobacterium lividum]
MRFLPYFSEEFTSPLSPAELLRCVHDTVQAKREFRGTVSAAGFAISRVIDYRNSMLPRITGRVAAGLAGGSRLYLTHELHPFALVIGGVWLLGVGSVVVGLVPLLAKELWAGRWRELTGPDFIPLGMLAFGVLLLTVPFWLEVRQSRPRLLALLRLQAAAPALPVGH